jgi:hypothetical protein
VYNKIHEALKKLKLDIGGENEQGAYGAALSVLLAVAIAAIDSNCA